MKNNRALFLGLVLVLIGVFWDSIKEVIPDTPDSTPDIVIEKPDDSMIAVWSETADSITAPKDRIYLCIFNKRFSERVKEYDADAQDVNDIYVLAAKDVFGDSINGKYDGLASAIKSAMSSVVGEENHELTDEEKKKLSETFKAFAWCLNN